MRFPNSTAFCGPMSRIEAFHVRTPITAPGIARYRRCGDTAHTSAALGLVTKPAAIATTVAAAIESQPSEAVSAV